MAKPHTNHDMKSKRFILVTDVIDIKKLERETNRFLLIGFFVAVIFHTSLGFFFLSKKPSGTAVRPIIVHVKIISPPRMTKPFTIRKREFRKRKLTQKPFETRTPSTDFQKISPELMDTPAVVDSLAWDNVYELFMSLRIPEMELRPDVRLEDRITREPENWISMKEELITIDDIEASNYGQIKGLVVTNPADKMSLTGIVYIPHIYDSRYPPNNMSGGILGLIDAVRSFTDIIGKADKHLNLYTNRKFRNPFIYISCTGLWEYKPFEAESMGDYLKSGGFVVLENKYYVSLTTPAEASLKQFIKDALGSQVRIYPLPNHHPLYHCYFDFDDGPPPEAIIKNKDDDIISIPIDYIEGIFIGDRLVGIYSNKGWGRIWGNRGHSTPQHRMGVNMVVYALRQSGKAAKYVDNTLARGINAQRSAFTLKHSQYQQTARNSY